MITLQWRCLPVHLVIPWSLVQHQMIVWASEALQGMAFTKAPSTYSGFGFLICNDLHDYVFWFLLPGFGFLIHNNLRNFGLQFLLLHFQAVKDTFFCRRSSRRMSNWLPKTGAIPRECFCCEVPSSYDLAWLLLVSWGLNPVLDWSTFPSFDSSSFIWFCNWSSSSKESDKPFHLLTTKTMPHRRSCQATSPTFSLVVVAHKYAPQRPSVKLCLLIFCEKNITNAPKHAKMLCCWFASK